MTSVAPRPPRTISAGDNPEPPGRGSVSRRVLVTLVLVLAVLAAGAAFSGWLASFKQPPPPREPLEKIYNVEVYEVEAADLREFISAFGTARADRKVMLAAQVAGRVERVHPGLKVGLKVSPPEVAVGPEGRSVRTPGDVLAEIDPTTYEKRVASARNKLAEDDAELKRLRQEIANNERMLRHVREDLATIEAEYRRIKDLADQGVNTASQLARAALESSGYRDSLIARENDAKLLPLKIEQVEKRRDSHQTDLDIAEHELSHTIVRPPFAGTVSDVKVEKGQYVQPGTPLVELTDDREVEVPVPITLTDFSRLAGSIGGEHLVPVELVESVTEPARWRGRLVRVAPQADPLTRTIEVFVMVDNESQPVPLKPGAFVHAAIQGPVHDGAVVVPRDAIVGGVVFVVDKEGLARRRTVNIGRTLQALALVESGIEPGDRVVLTNLDVLHEGARVVEQSRQSLDDVLARQRVRIVRRAGDVAVQVNAAPTGASPLSAGRSAAP
ncbi:MAG: efflux RND transporter periplasmic adaptor subunit [Planctomycetes bacterium]|nr:efflux RND transporter periplasmic adaptor subunit [Planctomycetota bacterium]